MMYIALGNPIINEILGPLDQVGREEKLTTGKDTLAILSTFNDTNKQTLELLKPNNITQCMKKFYLPSSSYAQTQKQTPKCVMNHLWWMLNFFINLLHLLEVVLGKIRGWTLNQVKISGLNSASKQSKSSTQPHNQV